MVNFKPLFFSFLVALLLFTSCSVQKRVYRHGYHVVWNHSKTKETKKEIDQRVKLVEAPVEEVVIASNEESDDVIPLKNRSIILLDKDTCGDVLLLQNADELAVKILEIDEQTIKYKRCDNINGPTYSISKSKVALIKYANGTKEVVVPERPTKQVAQNNPNNYDPNKPIPPRKTNLVGLASLLGQIAVNILSRQLGALLTTSGGLLTLFLLTLAPIVLAYVSLFQFKNNPEKYKGKWMPIVVLIVNIASLLVYALVITSSGIISSGAAGPIAAFMLVLALIMLGIFIAALIPKRLPVNTKQ